ncbi:MAG: hypothetical protein OXG05_09955 [Gammaproteobacteria bacterium]|nr:hypothetical protein [Gammaproteobacteria bacterium]
MQVITQTFLALISIDLFDAVLPPEDWTSTDDCPEDGICCYHFSGGGQS